jgi:hypothetical protein
MSLLDTASLIVTPNAYKEGKLYSVIPSDGSGDMSVVRATTATRVNSAGLVELVPYNLLTYSEQFDNADWSVQDATITPNSTTAPNGTLTADTFTRTANTGFLYSTNPLSLNTGSYSISVYAKANTISSFRLDLGTSGFSQGATCVFDLSNGTAATPILYGSSTSFVATIENVGNGWYRCSLSGNIISANYYAELAITTSGSIYAWGAQVNEGSLKDYFATETRLNIPRLDYSNGSCPSLLVEPQRTNLCTYSEDFTNVVWGKFLTTITPNTTMSPSGIQNADTFETSSNSSGVLFINSFVTSGDKTFSIYAKKGSNDILDMGFTDVTDFTARFNLSSGTLVSQTSGLTSTITSVGNDWYKLTVSKNITTLGSIFLINLTPSINKTMFLWGAQLEAGSYPTSYIPTTSASVTRNADVISKTGISSLIGQTEGVMFTDFICDGFEDYGTPLSINDGTASNYIWLTTFANGNIRAEVYNGAVQASITYTGGVVGQRYKVAFAYKQNDFVMYVNGTQIGTDTSGNIPPSLSRIDYNLANNWSLALLKVNATALWKTRLTNAQLAQLTTI